MDLAKEFSSIHKQIRQEGLLRKCPGYYDTVIVRNILMLAIVLASAILVQKYTENFLFQVPIAIMLGFVFGQFAYLAHDSGHEQISSRILPLIAVRYFANIFIYGPLTGWRIKHDLHHNEPNNIDLDPDCHLVILAFTKEQAQTKYGIARFIVKYQLYLFTLIAMFTSIGMRVTGIRYLLLTKCPGTILELTIVSASLFVYIALWTVVFGPFKGLLFMLMSEFTFGLYMGMTFITNHYGRSFEPNTKTDFLTKQVSAARNIGSSSRVADALIHFFYGGLNRQIEHHLWPYMPRCNLKRAEVIVRTQCKKLGVHHHAVSLRTAYIEIYRNLADIGRHLRAYDKQKAHLG